MPEETTSPVTDGQLIAGGEVVPLTFKGTLHQRDNAFVRQVRPSEVARYLQLESDELATLLFVTDLSAVEIDALTLDAYERLVAADRRQNFSAARARERRESERAARQLEVLRETNPEVYAELTAATKGRVESLISSLAPSPSAPAPGSTAPAA